MNLLIRISLLIALGALTSCNRNAQPTPSSSSPSASAPAAKRYHLIGKVVSIDKRARMADIDGEAIPGFMDAMTMPYPIKPESELDKLQPGDLITGDIVVQDDDSWLENVAVTGHAAANHGK